jgi:acetyltransferase-like isoleucine patch superfamily enzyme
MRALAEAWARYRLGGIHLVSALIPKLAKSQLVPVLRRYGATIGEECDLWPGLVVHNAVGDFSHLRLGDRVHLGPQCFLDLRAGITIGSEATISMRTTILTHSDPGASPVARLGFPPAAEAVTIGPGAYLGAGCTVLMGARIGMRAVVGAAALVRGAIPEETVAVGAPARVIRHLRRPEP